MVGGIGDCLRASQKGLCLINVSLPTVVQIQWKELSVIGSGLLPRGPLKLLNLPHVYSPLTSRKCKHERCNGLSPYVHISTAVILSVLSWQLPRSLNLISIVTRKNASWLVWYSGRVERWPTTSPLTVCTGLDLLPAFVEINAQILVLYARYYSRFIINGVQDNDCCTMILHTVLAHEFMNDWIWYTVAVKLTLWSTVLLTVVLTSQRSYQRTGN